LFGNAPAQSEIPLFARNDISWFLGDAGGISDRFENACVEGALECGSASYRRSLEFHGTSSAAALHDPLRV